MNADQWYEAQSGKVLDSIKITVTKVMLDKNTDLLTEHNHTYTIATLGHEALGEIVFTELDHQIEELYRKARHKVESRHRRTITNLNSNIRFL